MEGAAAAMRRVEMALHLRCLGLALARSSNKSLEGGGGAAVAAVAAGPLACTRALF